MSTPNAPAPPVTTDWNLVAVTGVALLVTVASFAWVLRSVRR